MSFVKSSIFCSVSLEKPLAAMATYLTSKSFIYSILLDCKDTKFFREKYVLLQFYTLFKRKSLLAILMPPSQE